MAGVTTAGRVRSVTSACRIPAVFTGPAASPGSAPVRRTGEVCSATKVKDVCISYSAANDKVKQLKIYKM